MAEQNGGNPFDFSSLMKAWQQMASAGAQAMGAGGAAQGAGPQMLLPDPEALEKKAQELEVVEKWLRSSADAVQSQAHMMRSQAEALRALNSAAASGPCPEAMESLGKCAGSVQEAFRLNMDIMARMQQAFGQMSALGGKK